MEQELPALIEQGVSLVCVLVRPMPVGRRSRRWSGLQWAHDPGRDGPVADSADPEGQIVRVCEKLLELLPAADGVSYRPPKAMLSRRSRCMLAASRRDRADGWASALGASCMAFRRCRRSSWPARSWLACGRRCSARSRGRSV